jgi:hypothetical protein
LVLALDTKSIAPPIPFTIFPCKTETENKQLYIFYFCCMWENKTNFQE